jgi:hypothetical protein
LLWLGTTAMATWIWHQSRTRQAAPDAQYPTQHEGWIKQS